MSDWNSTQYTKFERERTQPAIDLIQRIDISPRSILDIGCGPGNSTSRLFCRFPNSEILGIDNSNNMLKKATETYPELNFQKCDIPQELDALDNYDLIFSNACLHWIPNHADLFPKLMKKLNKGGMLAVQMPLVQNAMFYKMLNDLVATEKWHKLSKIKNFHNLMPGETYDILSALSKNVTMWETTYYHIVPSHSHVIEWYKGSGLRPYLERLDETEQREFENELLKLIESNYPIQADSSVILQMPRLFFTAIRQ